MNDLVKATLIVFGCGILTGIAIGIIIGDIL